MPADLISLTVVNGEPRVDSRLIAEQLGILHKNTRELIQEYLGDFEEFGKVPFETEASGKTNQPQKFVLLNEDQSYLLLTYAQNTEQARALKKRLVQSFGEHRRRQATPIPVFPITRQSERPRVAQLSTETINALAQIKADLGITEGFMTPRPVRHSPIDCLALFRAVVEDILAWRYPYSFAYGFDITGQGYLLIRLSDVMHHLTHIPHFQHFFGWMDGRDCYRIEKELRWSGLVKKAKPAPAVDGVRLNYCLKLSALRPQED